MKNKYPEHILQKLRQREDLDEDDTSMDDELNKLSPSEAFTEVLMWEGFGRYDITIKGWIEDIYGIDIDKINE